MNDAEGLPVGTYQATYYPEADRDFNRALVRSYWRRWASYCFRLGAQIFLITFFIFVCAGIPERAEDHTYRMILVCTLGFGIGFIWAAHKWYEAYFPKDSSNVGEVWSCKVTDVAWSFESKDGLFVEVPFQIMRIRFTHPEGWLVQYGRTHVTVFRRPLREAGLEEAFFERVPRR